MLAESLREGGHFWSDAVHADVAPATAERWRALRRLFHEHPDPSEPSFASIGFFDDAAAEPLGSCQPCPAFARTPMGSAVGILLGHVVWT